MGFLDFLFGTRNYADKNANDDKHAYSDLTTNTPGFRDEFASDLAADTHYLDRNIPANSYSESGVDLQDTQNILRLAYSGILAQDGADDVYAVVGYGNNLRWENVEFYRMNRVSDKSYETYLPIKHSENINIVFKDGADHWDNNSGINYTFTNEYNAR